MAKAQWGILSTSNLAVKKVIPAMQASEHSDVAAIASRDRTLAQQVAAQLNIPTAYGSYEDLLADPDVAIVYNPLPNHLHVPWSIRSLEAGKHVLCEKPIGLNTGDAQQLAQAAARYPHLKVMEAFMYRFHPQWQAARTAVQKGDIGTLRTVSTLFSYYLTDPANIRNIPAAGGGALLDIGCYATSVARFLFAAEPTRVVSAIEYDPSLGIDRLVSGILDFGSGIATFTCSTQISPYQRVNIFGTSGRIEIEIPFNAPPNRPCTVWETDRSGAIEEKVFPIVDQYALQADAFSLAVLNDEPVPPPLADAVANMRVLDALMQSARQKSWIEVDVTSG
jgi:predicted dehydrogenase